MKFIYRTLGAVSYDHLNDVLAKLVQDLEIDRNNKRKIALDSIEQLDIKVDAEKIQKTLIELNRDLTNSYEKEKFVLEFINLLKT